jgi:hypothetical protein
MFQKCFFATDLTDFHRKKEKISNPVLICVISGH